MVVVLIFLNLFIAIILEGFTTTNNAMSSLLQEDDFDRFVECWAKLDITVRNLNSLLLNLGIWLSEVVGFSSLPL